MAHGLDKRLVDAARRVAGKMPKHLAKATEKELVDSIERQNKETQRAKYVVFVKLRLKCLNYLYFFSESNLKLADLKKTLQKGLFFSTSVSLHKYQ